MSNQDYQKVQQNAEECFQKWCEKHFIDSDNLSKARRILEDVVNRRLPKFVGEARLKEDGLKQEEGGSKAQPVKAFKIKAYQKLLEESWKSDPKAPKDCEIYVLEMGFGEVGNEPIENVHFYSKQEPNKAFKMEKYQVSSLKPRKFHEWLVRVYYDPKGREDQEEVQQKAEYFHEWCERNKNNFIDFGPHPGNCNFATIYAFIYEKEIDVYEEVGDEKEDVYEEEKKNVDVETPRKIFNDPIYGQIEFDPLLVKIIDTPQFQRLRHIKQLGGTYLVYPGATHTRFEHSLGMAHLAGCMIDVLKKNHKDLISPKDEMCVKIAALCYNLGHGPFSFLYENFLKEALKRGENWKETSHLILQDIDKELKGKINKIDKDLTFIKNLIDGKYATSDKMKKKRKWSEDKTFLFEIVINKLNGIDVRRWDYFARDCYHLGIPNSFDHQRLLKSAQVCEVNGRNHICFRDKVADSVYDMFKTQYTLYSQAYQHKIVNIIEIKITEALKAAEGKLTNISPFTEGPSSSRGGSRKRKMASNKERVAKLSKLTDHIFEEILYSTDEELKDARMKLEDVVNRRLPKCVGETRITKAEFKDKQIFQENWNKAVEEWNKHPTVFLDKKDFIIDVIRLDCTFSTGKNPIDKVYFYRKSNPTEAFKIKKYEVSSLLPEEFTEYVGRVYCTKNSEEEERDAKECFKWWRRGKPEIKVYDKDDFGGNECVITGDCPSLDRCGIDVVRSCKVNKGIWKLYEGRDYNEPRYQLEKKDYSNPAEWGATNPAQSLKRVTE
ncbi:deoxynucleoside triphosphate triphosphohydrolase SAMHD1-like [Megalobrama amblycephala]|nr:deoxynucleoside triphosphate triphosphohydrolase SAMHD1-like [Megalobrama amblycephala]